MPKNMTANSAGIRTTIWIEVDPRSGCTAVLALRRRQNARGMVKADMGVSYLIWPDLVVT